MWTQVLNNAKGIPRLGQAEKLRSQLQENLGAALGLCFKCLISATWSSKVMCKISISFLPEVGNRVFIEIPTLDTKDLTSCSLGALNTVRPTCSLMHLKAMLCILSAHLTSFDYDIR